MKVYCRLLFALVLLLVVARSRADIGLEPIPDQTIPSGKTLVVPLVATDPDGPARTYTVSLGSPSISGSGAVGSVLATIRTGDPHLMVGVSYTDSNSVAQTGTMEFQLLREFAPLTTQIIAGLTEGGYYNPRPSVSGTTYVPFHRVLAGFAIQGGDPTGTGTGGPGFTFPNEFNNALIFSGSYGQLAMANAGYTDANDSNGTNGSQFFVTLGQERNLDFGYNLFGQLLRGSDTLFGIAGTAVQQLAPGDEDSSPINPVNITSATVFHNDTDAVLLLSATGICNQTVTVTAASGTGTSVQSFVAHAVADTTDDRPFLQPVPNSASPDQTTKVVLRGTDLQRDLLRYGYQRLLPTQGSQITWSASPALDIPMASSTDNCVAAVLANWNESNAGVNPTFDAVTDVRIFHVAAGDKPLRGTLGNLGPGALGSLNLQNVAVATIIAGNPKDTAGSFTASVNWGDGGLVTGSNVIVEKNGNGSLNEYKLIASHLYANPGEYPVLVNIADTNGARLALTGTVNVAASAIAITGSDLYRAGGVFKNQTVATFTDAGPGGTILDYAATIDWGDGTVTAGTLKEVNNAYEVLGTHTYKSPQNYTVSVYVQRGSNSSDSACEWFTAHISGINQAPAIFPPFNQAHLAQAWIQLTGGDLTVVVSGSNESQAYLSGTATIVNSGNEPSKPGSLSVYLDPESELDGSAIPYTASGATVFKIPAIPPGRAYSVSFEQKGAVDNRLKLPPGDDPSGQYIFGVVTYSDPVADYNGTQKAILIGSY